MAHQTDTPVQINTLPQMVFSSQFPDVLIPHSGVGGLLVSVDIGGETVIQDTLVAVGNGIVLEDMRSLVEPYARQYLTVLVTITAGSYEATVRVLYSAADMGDDVTAQAFYEGYFLTTLQGAKMTALGRLEFLNYFGTGTASVMAYYDDGTSHEFAAVATGGNLDYTQIDVSPSQYVAEGKTLCRYLVECGTRQQEFIVEPEVLDCAPILLFVNSFGVEELLYCTGLHQVTPEYKRSQVRIGRFKRTYKLEEVRHFKADSGPLTRAMADWVDELLRSDEIRVCNYYNQQVRPGREVIINDSKSDRSNDDAELPRITFTYEYAQRNHNVMQLYREGRIFDNTFDNTFN